MLFLERKHMGKIVALVSGKGGTGKSTLCVTLGMVLVRKGYRVLLIDCDCGMRALDILMEIDRNLVFDISDVIKGNCTEEKIIYPCEFCEGLFLISAPQNPDDLVCKEDMKHFTDSIRNQFDYILLDAPSGIGKAMESAVYNADICLVVANAEAVSVRCCVSVRRKLYDLDKNNIRLIINKFSKKEFRKNPDYPDLDSIIDETGIQLIGIIADDKKTIRSLRSAMQSVRGVSAMECVRRTACRIDGENIPLLIC